MMLVVDGDVEVMSDLDKSACCTQVGLTAWVIAWLDAKGSDAAWSKHVAL